MIKEIKVIDVLQILDDSCISVRIRTDIVKNDTEILASNFARNVLTPGEFDLAKELLKDKYAIAEVLWTPETIASYTNKMKAAQESSKNRQ